jgi:hypothetical protein
MSLQIRRGSSFQLQSVTPAEGELLYTTDTKKVYVGDGATRGGISINSNIGNGYTGSAGEMGDIGYTGSRGNSGYTGSAGSGSSDRLVKGNAELVLETDGVITSVAFPARDGGKIFLSGVEFGAVPADPEDTSPTPLVLSSQQGEVRISSNAQGPRPVWSFKQNGTIDVPVPQGGLFTLTFSSANFIPRVDKTTLTLSGAPWVLQGQIQRNADGSAELQLNQIFPKLNNPGYVSGDTFTFNDQVHHLFGFNLEIVLADVVQAGPSGWTANLQANQLPDYPSTVNSDGAIKLTANENSWVFDVFGNLQLPAGGDIVDSTGASVLGGGTGSGLSVSDFGRGFTNTLDAGKITTSKLYNKNPNPALNNHFELSVDDGGVVHLPDQSIINGATLKTVPGNYAGITAGPVGKDEDSWVWVDNDGAWISTKESTTAYTWHFDNNGKLTLPGQSTINNPATVPPIGARYNGFHTPDDADLQYFGTDTITVVFPDPKIAVDLQSYIGNVGVRIRSDQGGAGISVTSIVCVDTVPDVNSSWIVTAPGANFSSDPSSWGGPGNHCIFSNNIAPGGIPSPGVTITTPSYQRWADDYFTKFGPDHEWKFGTDGKLTLPANGDIIDSNGNSVLGGGASTGNIRFDNTWIKNVDTGNIYISPQDGFTYLDLPSDTQASAGNKVTLTNEAATGGVRIRAGQQGKKWDFNYDGSITFPDNKISQVSNSNLGIQTSKSLTTDNIIRNGSGFEFTTDETVIGFGVIPGWSQRNSQQIEVNLFVAPAPVYVLLTSLALGRTVIVTYSTGSGNQTFTGVLSQLFTATGQYDQFSRQRYSGRIDGTIPADQTGIVSINFPELRTQTNNWQFSDDGSLTLPEGSAIDETTGVSANIKVNGKAWAFGTNGKLTLPQGSIIGETATTTVITPPGAAAGQSLVIRPTAVGALSASGNIVPGTNLTITLTNQSGSVDYTGVTYTITGATAQQLGIGSLTGTFSAFSPSGSVPQTTTLVLPIPGNSSATTFTLTVGGANPFNNNSITVTDNGVIETSHVHLVAGNPVTTDIYLGDDDQYVKIVKNGGDVVIGTDSNTNQWIFGTDGALTLPNSSKLRPSTTAYDTALAGWEFIRSGEITDRMTDNLATAEGWPMVNWYPTGATAQGYIDFLLNAWTLQNTAGATLIIIPPMTTSFYAQMRAALIAIRDSYNTSTTAVSLSSAYGKSWNFGADGKLTLPTPAPITFTANLVPVYHAGGGGDAWYYTVVFQPNANGDVVTMISGGGRVWDHNPGYESGDSWNFTETGSPGLPGHGIPGYTFTLTLASVNDLGDGEWTADFAVSQGPAYPSTVKSTATIKLSADTKNWTFHTDGKLTLPDNSVITSYKPVTVIAGPTSVQTILDNASATRLTFIESVDSVGAFTNSTFTVPYTGYYQFNATVYFTSNVTLTDGFLVILNTTSGLNELDTLYYGAFSGRVINGSSMQYLTAGDTVTLFFRQVSGNVVDIGSSSRLTIHRVSIN